MKEPIRNSGVTYHQFQEISRYNLLLTDGWRVLHGNDGLDSAFGILTSGQNGLGFNFPRGWRGSLLTKSQPGKSVEKAGFAGISGDWSVTDGRPGLEERSRAEAAHPGGQHHSWDDQTSIFSNKCFLLRQ